MNLDEKMARVMNFTIIDDLHVINEYGEYVCDGTPWRPSTIMAWAMLVEDRIGELGLEMAYVHALIKICVTEFEMLDLLGVVKAWRLIHATPEQRCLAAEKAMEGGK